MPQLTRRRQLVGTELPDLPPTPAIDPLAPLKALSIPPDVSDIESKLTINPSAHATLPVEAGALTQTRQASNFAPALAGLKANQTNIPQSPAENRSFMGQQLIGPSRNQAMVDRMRADLGMAPEAPGDASISQAQLEAEHGPHEAFAHMIEQMKASAPVTAAATAAKGQLAVKEAELGGQREAEQAGYQQLQDLLNSGQLTPGTTLSTPRGFTVRTAAPSQMLPPGVGGPAQQELEKARTALAQLPMPGSLQGWLEESKGAVTGKSLAQRRAELQQKVNDLERQLGLQSSAAGSTNVAPANGLGVDEAAPSGARPGGKWIQLPSGRKVYQEP